MKSILDIDVIRQAPFEKEPYPYLVNSDFIRPEVIADLEKDFPDIKTTGFHPIADLELKGSFKKLIDELHEKPLIDALSEKFGMDFSVFPTFISVRKLSAAHEGRIHCDSKSKVMSMLIYMNQEWESAEGQLRVLYNEKSFEEYKTELSAKMGTVFAFLRADNSWHGHKPFVGERRVVQIAWLRSQEEADRKAKRHRLSGFLKKIFRKQSSSEMM